MQLNPHQKEILAVLFACGDPMEASRIAEALELDTETVHRMVALLADHLEAADIPLKIVRLGDRYQLCTLQDHAGVIRSALEIKRNVPLTQASFEVLAIIAYNQPVSKSFVEQVRGIDSGGVVNALVEKGLVEEAGRMDLPGRPLAYRTTPVFLRCFGLESLDDLPPVLPDTEELEETEADKRLPTDQIGFESDEYDGETLPGDPPEPARWEEEDRVNLELISL